MKKLSYIFAICAAALVSCSKPELGADDAMAPGLNITLRMSGPATKAGSTMPGVAELNENKIESIAYFVFNTEDGSLINKGTKTVSADVSESGIKVNLALSEEMFADIMYATGHSKVYVIANATEAFSGLSTIAEIESKLLTLTKTEGKQDSFVMYGTSTSIVETASVGDKRRAVVAVELKRVLAKVSLKVTVDKIFEKAVNADGTELEDGQSSDVKIRWTSNSAEVKVEFCGLAKQAKIAPEASFKPELFNLDYKTYTPNAAATEPSYDCLSDVPYYTYPRTWTIDDETKPYFLVSIPWTSEIIGTPAGDWFKPTTATTYYKIILGGNFASNNWYAISVALKGLGSLTPGTAVEIKPLDLTVADWRNSVEGETAFHTEAQFQDARVLDIPQDVVTLYNQNSAKVSFISSHDCEIESVKLVTYDFTTTPRATKKTTTVDPASGVFAIEGRNILFNHVLHNSLSDESLDYQDLSYTVVIRHRDDEGKSFKDSFVLIQKPALVINTELNSKTAGTSSSRTNYVNNSQNNASQSSSATYYGGTVSSLGDGSNNNPNMFIISASVLGDGMIIGDPRSANFESWSSASVKDVKGTSRKISYYYRTDPSKGNVVAPKFRIASSWGKTYTLSYENAVKRCSSYQEDGYPAGRWRVPTEAEVRFMMTLSGRGYIDVLFSEDNYYWCNTGAIKTKNKVISISTKQTSEAVRCVYDEWYWENSKYATVGKNTFTWGDMKREDFE